MVRELTLAKHLVTNQWRELLFSRRAPGLIYLIFIAAFPYVLYKYWMFLQAAAAAAAGSPAELKDNYDLAILFLLNLVCWFLPVLSSQQISSKLKTAKFFPLSFRSLYFVRYLSFFLVPASIFALLFSALSFYPIFYKANFLFATLYSAAVIFFSISAGFALTNILNLRNGRAMVFGAAILLTGGLFLSHTSLAEAGASINGLLTSFFAAFLYPSSIFFTLLTAFCLVLMGSAASAASFKLFWEQETTGSGGGKRLLKNARNFRLSGDSGFFIRYGLLLQRNLKDQIQNSFNPYLSFLVTIYYAYFLNGSGGGGDVYASFNVLLSFIFIPQALVFYNFFGFERVSSIERYASLPIRPAMLVKIKNLAAVMLSSISLITVLPVIYLKFSFAFALGFFLKWCLLAAGYLSAGNILSVYFPFNRKTSRWLPNELLFGYAGMILITGFILILIDSLSDSGGVNRANLVNAGALIIYGLFYLISLKWNNRYLSRRWENIRNAIAK